MDMLHAIIGGGKRWTKEEEAKIIGIIDEYRADIEGKSLNEVSRITWEYASMLSHAPALKNMNRTITAIYSHIPYLDDFIAGVEKEEDYYRGITKSWFFGSWERRDKDKNPNPCPRIPYKEINNSRQV